MHHQSLFPLFNDAAVCAQWDGMRFWLQPTICRTRAAVEFRTRFFSIVEQNVDDKSIVNWMLNLIKWTEDDGMHVLSGSDMDARGNATIILFHIALNLLLF